MKEIPLTKGKVALVDDDDFGWLSQYKWTAKANKNGTWYAWRNVKGCAGKRIYMHREILRVPSNMDTDHKNGNGLDNQKNNIRVCTTAENLHNSKAFRTPKTSRFKGVYWDKSNTKWKAHIALNSKRLTLGYFDSEIDAAKEYDMAALRFYGEFASLNFQST